MLLADDNLRRDEFLVKDCQCPVYPPVFLMLSSDDASSTFTEPTVTVSCPNGQFQRA